MAIDVIIPAIRTDTVGRLVESLAYQSRKPDHVWVISNEVGAFDPFGLEVTVVRFSSRVYGYGYRDVVLRRNLGMHLSDAEILIFQDDDLIAAPDMVEASGDLLASQTMVWGHHRYVDFDGRSVMEIMELAPSVGVEREHPPNGEHAYYSCYAGMLGAKRSEMEDLGGFDMAFLNRHGNEDQHLGRRWMAKYGLDTVTIYEPPFSWHPTETARTDVSPLTNVENSDHHELVRVEVNDQVRFLQCQTCPYQVVDNIDVLMEQPTVTLGFRPELVSYHKETR